jgi:16S rRNA (guanine527-N7)-methyltransferase
MMIADVVIGSAPVSRETQDKLHAYVAMLTRWNATINLVSRNAIAEIWPRHILDSTQLFSLLGGGEKRLVDLGSGGGLPGVPLAILAQSYMAGLTVTLVESDQRKASFLRSVGRQLDIPIHVIDARIESVEPLEAGVLTARALAPLDSLLGYANRHLMAGGRALFLKGSGAKGEIDVARSTWNFDVSTHQSITHADGVILEITAINRRTETKFGGASV